MADTGAPLVGAGALRLLHADAHLLAFDKQAGLPSVPGRGPELQDCLASRARACWPDALVVHRLDMATSGVIVMARGPDMQRRLGAAFADREVDKDYLAQVDGWLRDDRGEIALPLAADWPNRPRQKVDTAGGKPALTRWHVLARGRRDDGVRYSHVQLHPVTGRTHQLRVHLQAIGHPILGDTLYATGQALAGAPRLMLHAWRLALVHPATGLPFRVEAPPPAGLDGAIASASEDTRPQQ